MKKYTLLFIMFALLPSFAMAQKKQFTLDDLIPGGATYRQNTYPDNRYIIWWGEHCLMLDVDRCYMINRDTGAEVKVVFFLDGVNNALKKAGLKTINSLLYCSMPYADKPYILVKRTDREMALLDGKDGNVLWSASLEPGATNIDRFDKTLAYTVDHNLYVLDEMGKTHTISKDGCLDITYGESVHRDEFGISKGTFWSPKGNYLAFYRMDQSMVSSYPQVNINPNIDKSRCAQVEPDKYPMAGETSHKVTVGIFDIKKDKTIYLDAGDPTDRYFTNIAWSPDESKIYMIELNRDQNHGELVEYDVKTGARLRTVFEESNAKYFEPCNPIQFLPWNSDKFIYLTRKDGYNHIYLYNTKGKMLKQLTSGKFEVMDILGFNEKAKTIIYTSNEISPIQKNVFKVNMKAKRESIGNTTGWHSASLSPSGNDIIDNYSSPLFSRHVDVVSTLDGWTSNIFSAPDKWAQFNAPQFKVGTIKAADGVTDLYYRLTLPPDFDAKKKYPAVIYVYGGPHAHVVDASFHYGARGWDVYMAQKGYVMLSLDNRGSEHRGLEFEQATFRNLGVEEMKDQMKGVEFLKSLPYVDASRLGVHGWSFGGFMTTSLMTTYPDVFKCGVAGGPVIDWKYYEVMYGERYMDTPESNPEGYKNTSLLNKAGNLKGRLMIIYGGNDPTCVPQHTLSFIRACIDAGTYPDLFTYPGDGHNMFGTDRVHLHEVITRYFEDHLK
ncbi:MAG: S9 family peptidase [Bacteroidaceae bacterium]|nr:S9 family peptidase [Bacteroidaceae bacterium]